MVLDLNLAKEGRIYTEIEALKKQFADCDTATIKYIQGAITLTQLRPYSEKAEELRARIKELEAQLPTGDK
jgi:hypothetical protein